MFLYDPLVKVKLNPTTYVNSENIQEWIEEQLGPALNIQQALNSQPALLALDIFWWPQDG